MTTHFMETKLAGNLQHPSKLSGESKAYSSHAMCTIQTISRALASS